MEQSIVFVRVDSSAKPLQCVFEETLKKDDFVVLETPVGLELGVVERLGNEEIKETINILIIADIKDIEKAQENAKKLPMYKERTKEIVKKLNLEMKIFDASVTLDDKKLLVFFTAEGRVDFRELVKEMAATFKKRIELRQVGARDEVQKMGSVGICGKECCCGKFLTDFNHVSIKMAKVQGLSLMPNNITGACGKLLCCLEYENDEYNKIFKQMPAVNSTIKTPDGNGVVVFNNLIKKLVQVRVKDEVKEYPMDVILKHNKKEKDEK